MRRKSILSALLATAILGGMLWLFPHLWMLLVLMVLVLVTTQVILVRRHLFTLPPGRTEMAMPAAPSLSTIPGKRPESAPDAVEPEAKAERIDEAFEEKSPAPNAKAAGKTASADTEGNGSSKEDAMAPAIDQSVFSRFREHLMQAEQEERTRPPGTARRAPGTAPANEDEVEDLVDISSAARRPTDPDRSGEKPAERKSPKPPESSKSPAPAEEEEGPDLFADLRPPPVTSGQGGEIPEETEAQALEGEPPEGEANATEPDTGPEAIPQATPQSGESGVPLPTADGKTTGVEEEAGALLKLAEEAAGREDWEEARAGLENYLAHLAGHPRLIHWRARQLEVRMALRSNDANRALQGFESMLESGYQPTVEGVPSLLETLLAGAAEKEADNLRVSMLVRMLAVFRQERDQGAMDIAYGWIEQAQEKAGDERKLIQYLKNHLEIRKAMGNVNGQLELIDQLGNRCYKLGLTEDAKHYYEMGLKLKGEKPEDGTDSPEAVKQ